MSLRYRRLMSSYKKAVGISAPTDIAGCEFWFDFSDADTLFTDAGITKVSNNGDSIAQANDKSGNDNNIKVHPDGTSPLYTTNYKNDLSVAHFTAANSLLINISPYSLSYPNTVFIVGDYGSGKVFTDNGRNCESLRSYNMYSGAYLEYTNIVNREVLISVLFNTETNVYQNGILDATGSCGTSGMSGIGLGARYDLWNGGEGLPSYAYEYIAYNRNLLDVDRQSVEAYLNNKWSIY